MRSMLCFIFCSVANISPPAITPSPEVRALFDLHQGLDEGPMEVPSLRTQGTLSNIPVNNINIMFGPSVSSWMTFSRRCSIKPIRCCMSMVAHQNGRGRNTGGEKRDTSKLTELAPGGPHQRQSSNKQAAFQILQEPLSATSGRLGS